MQLNVDAAKRSPSMDIDGRTLVYIYMIPAIGPQTALFFVLAGFVLNVFFLAVFVLAVFVLAFFVLAVFLPAVFVLAVLF